MKDEIQGKAGLIPLDRLIERSDFYAIQRCQFGVENDLLAANQKDLALNRLRCEGTLPGHSISWLEITSCDLKPSIEGWPPASQSTITLAPTRARGCHPRRTLQTSQRLQLSGVSRRVTRACRRRP